MLALLGDSITTDHISPAGNIKKDSPAGKYLIEHGVEPKDFNSVRRPARQPRSDDARHLRQRPAARTCSCRASEGGVTRHLPDGAEMSIFDAAMQYQKDGMPLIVIAGKEYGSGSSRDWAAKGTHCSACRR